MLFKNFRVPMPLRKVLRKIRKNGCTYIYYNAFSFMNKYGNPTSKQIAIGKLDIETGDLIPNSNYFEFFPEHKPDVFPESNKSKTKKTTARAHVSSLDSSSSIQIKSYGIPVAMMAVAEQTGLLNVLQNCFPDKWERLLATAFYMVSKGNVMSYISDWFEENKIDFSKPMNNVDCGELFESVTVEERHLFFSHWIRHLSEQKYITFDVTSISTYSDDLELAEWGYNRDKDPLPQLNFGMFYGNTSRSPVYYDLYSGSITDKSHLPFVLQNAKEHGINKTCFVFDGTFVTEQNLLYMFNEGYSFISSYSSSRDVAKALIDEVKGSIEKVANRIDELASYGIKTTVKLYGIDYQAYVYFSPERKSFETKEIYGTIDKLSKDLKEINKSSQITRRFTEYFKFHKQTKSSFTYELDTKKIDEKISRTGFFVLLSTDLNLDCGEILKIYREKDVIEKNFHQLKNDLDFRRLKTHWNKTTDGKMFVGFLALILRTNMHSIFRKNLETKKMTFAKILIELTKIRIVRIQGEKEIRSTLTKKQKDILKALKISYDTKI